VYFHSKFKFRVDSIWLDWQKENNNYLKKQVALICLYSREQQTEVVHPLTDFIFNNWRYSSYNTQRKHSLNVVAFLNFLLEKRHEYRLSSLFDVEIVHAERYLNQLTKLGNARETLKGKERTLVSFYRYLLKQECLPKVSPKSFFSKLY
jgi:hypothetical protein